MDSFWLVIVLIVVGVVLCILCFGWFSGEYIARELTPKIKDLGYEDVEDVQVFCQRIGASLEDFIKSKGLRRQYERFREGSSTDFIQQAEAKKKRDDAESEGQATGMAIGVGMGTAIHSGGK